MFCGFVKASIPLLICTILVACGSGGGSSSGVPPTSSSAASTSSNSSSSSSSSTSSSSSSSGIAIPEGGFLSDEFEQPDSPAKLKPVTLRRLNRSEYNNTVRDLLGTLQKPANEFPEDDFGYGFNNIGDVLTVSLAHVEKYDQAATLLLEEFLNSESTSNWSFEAEDAQSDGKMYSYSYATGWAFGVPASIYIDVDMPASGLYRLSFTAGQDAAGDEPANLDIALGNDSLGSIDVEAPRAAMAVSSIEVNLPKGQSVLTLSFTNDYWVKDLADRNLYLDVMEIEGPLKGDSQANIDCPIANTKNQVCLEEILNNFVPKAWRRSVVSDEEYANLIAVFNAVEQAGGSFDEGLFYTLKAVLLSPNFIFRPEIHSENNERDLGDAELATRLSYFLWSSMPDEELSSIFDQNKLSDEEQLKAQVQRMLDDEKSQALIENFAVQWLGFDQVASATPDRTQFPEFDSSLVEALRQETRFFLSDLLKRNAPISELFSANYSFINGRLANHYGVAIDNSQPFLIAENKQQFYKHNWANADRYGILGHASVLTATSNPASTSPVKRGKWVLTNLLCKEPPPPPPNVENIAENLVNQDLSTRDRFALHSEDGVCAFCHKEMDPIGFGLESYNPIGRIRTMEGSHIIDDSGVMPDGTSFSGPGELSQLLSTSNRLAMCFIENLSTYALGRGVEGIREEGGDDYALVYEIYKKTESNNHRIADIIEAIVLSDSFRKVSGVEEVQP